MNTTTISQPINPSVLDTVGHTPLLQLDGISAKLETTNPTGSIKDRMAKYIIQQAEERGELTAGQQIIEITSGNTGIALAMISAARGYHFTAVMPESMSAERITMMRSFGAEVILTPAKDDIPGAMARYRELVAANPDAFLPNQFANPDNITAHRDGLGQEIITQTDGQVEALVAGVGTGGTLIGVAQALREINPDLKVIAIEPAESAVLSGGKPDLHQIQGIGEGFIPPLVKNNLDLIDEVITVASEDAKRSAQEIAVRHGLLIGISSGANMLAARQIKEKYDLQHVVTVLPDRGERYLSTDTFD